MSLYARRNIPFELFEVNLLGANDKQLLQISQESGLALNLDEMKAVKRYFSRKKRNPTDVELQTIGQTWSEHCYHKTFKGNIATPKGEVESLFKTYIQPPICNLAVWRSSHWNRRRHKRHTRRVGRSHSLHRRLGLWSLEL